MEHEIEKTIAEAVAAGIESEENYSQVAERVRLALEAAGYLTPEHKH